MEDDTWWTPWRDALAARRWKSTRAIPLRICWPSVEVALHGGAFPLRLRHVREALITVVHVRGVVEIP